MTNNGLPKASIDRIYERLIETGVLTREQVEWEQAENQRVDRELNGVSAGVPEPSLPSIVYGNEIAARTIVLPEELISGMLHRGAKMVLGGGSKSFKTWCLADLAISIATGRQWWGRDVRQGRVIYLNLEVQTAFFEQRLQTLAKAKGCSLPSALGVWNLRGHCMDHRILLPMLAERLAGEDYAAIILDPTYKVMAGSENAQEEVAALMDSIEKLGAKTGAAMIFGSHFAKGNAAGKEAIDRISGSGVFARDPDAILTMTRHEEDGVFVIDPILRNCPPVDPFCVKWEFPLMRSASEMDATKLREPGRRVKSQTPPTPEKIVEVVEKEFGNDEMLGAVNAEGGIFAVIESKLNVTRGAAQKGIDAAANGKGLVRDERRRPDGRGSLQVFYKLDDNKHFNGSKIPKRESV